MLIFRDYDLDVSGIIISNRDVDYVANFKRKWWMYLIGVLVMATYPVIGRKDKNLSYSFSWNMYVRKPEWW